MGFQSKIQSDYSVREISEFLCEKQYNIGELYGVDKPIQDCDFYERNFVGVINSSKSMKQFEDLAACKPVNEDEKFERYKQLFIYHYLYKIDSNNRKFILLKKQ